MKRCISIVLIFVLLASALPAAAGAAGCAHRFSSQGGNACLDCGFQYEIVPEPCRKTLEVACESAALRTAPYSKSGEQVPGSPLPRGTRVEVTHKLLNSLGNAWYITDSGYYIYAAHLTEPSRDCALVYHANGGAGAPEPECVPAGIAHKLSGEAPTRKGCRFLGWSSVRGASIAQWKAGDTITLEEDTLLYAVWAKFRQDITVDSRMKAALDHQEGFPQVREFHPDGSMGAGLCTTSATALMIKRKQVVDGAENGTFDFIDVRMSHGKNEHKSPDTFYTIDTSHMTEQELWQMEFSADWTPPTGFSDWHSTNNERAQTVYYTESLRLNHLGADAKSREANLISLLQAHPEGIVVYCSYGPGYHAILLTGYENGEFYACDSMNVLDVERDTPAFEAPDYIPSKTPTKLSQTWLYHRLGAASAEDVWNCLVTFQTGCVWYISSISYPG